VVHIEAMSAAWTIASLLLIASDLYMALLASPAAMSSATYMEGIAVLLSMRAR
jgi:hypothetical protein